MKVRDIMTTDIATARLDSDLEEVARMMKDEDTGAIPVLDDEGDLCGIITDRDIVLRVVAEGKDTSDTTVDDVLTEDLQTISPDADVEQAARLMSDKQIRRLPVVEEDELVGMISMGDIAVKSDDEQVAGETLSEVSEGVKQESGRRAGSSASRQRRSRSQKASTGRLRLISNRNPRQEQKRQARVAPARSQKRTAHRRKAS